MIVISLMDIYPAVTESGYECEMGFAGASSTLGTFSQFVCWVTDVSVPWRVCKLNAVQSFFSEFFDQVSLFFGLVLLSSPKPSITYVKACRYLITFSALESLVGLAYYGIAYAQGASFLTKSNSCPYTALQDMTAVNADVMSHALKGIIYESLSLVFYTGFVWGTFVLVEILKRGGTGDERIAQSDVLGLIKRDPPKILVLSSAFGILPLRPASIMISLGLLGMCLFNGFNNMWRMFSWCGLFDMEANWCRWPYGVLSAVDQLVCILLCLYTIRCLMQLAPGVKLPHLASLWGYLTLSSLVFIGGALYISTEKYPAYWLSGIRSDVWVYYARFWMSAVLLVLTRSISVLRVAGGSGSEDDRNATEMIYEHLSEKKDQDAASDADSLNDLLGLSSADIVPTSAASTKRASLWNYFSGGDEPASVGKSAAEMSSRETSGVATPVVEDPSATAPIVAQALQGLADEASPN